MASPHYTTLEQHSPEPDKKVSPKLPARAGWVLRAVVSALAGGFLISLTMNVALAVQLMARNHGHGNVPSPYAGLVRDVNRPWTNTTDYVSSNMVIQDQAWNALEDENHVGTVALSDEYAHAHGLLDSQRWPWDSKKGIYVLTGFHQVHCVKPAKLAVRQTIHEARKGVPVTYPPHHLDHCLDFLRDDAMCKADDLPLYSGCRNGQADNPIPIAGIGQQRMCKSWSELTKWATENSACWQVFEKDLEKPTSEHYKYCPDWRVFWSVD